MQSSSTTNALSRFGLQLDTTATAEEKLASLVEQTAAMFEVSQERADTLSGRWVQMKNVVGDLREEFGRLIVSSDAKEWIGQCTEAVRTFTAALQTDVQTAFLVLGQLAGASLGVGIAEGLEALARETNVLAKLPDKLGEFFDSVNLLGKAFDGLGAAARKSAQDAVEAIQVLAAAEGQMRIPTGPGVTPDLGLEPPTAPPGAPASAAIQATVAAARGRRTAGQRFRTRETLSAAADTNVAC